MMTNFKMRLTRSATGRMVLHIGCLLRGGQWNFHWAGLRRQLHNTRCTGDLEN